jgi:hypothetical protein
MQACTHQASSVYLACGAPAAASVLMCIMCLCMQQASQSRVVSTSAAATHAMAAACWQLALGVSSACQVVGAAAQRLAASRECDVSNMCACALATDAAQRCCQWACGLVAIGLCLWQSLAGAAVVHQWQGASHVAALHCVHAWCASHMHTPQVCMHAEHHTLVVCSTCTAAYLCQFTLWCHSLVQLVQQTVGTRQQQGAAGC